MKLWILPFAIWLGANLPADQQVEVSMRIVNGRGEPVSGAKVFFVQELAPGFLAEAQSDGAGKLRFRGLPAGARALLLHPRYLPIEVQIVGGAELAIRLQTGATSRIEVRLAGDAKLEGHLEARVFPASWVGKYDVERLPALAEFDKFVELPSAKGYVMEVGGPGLERCRVVEQGPHSLLLRRGATLQGRVVFDKGAMPESILVHLGRPRDHPQETVDPRLLRVAFAGPDGHFRLDGVPSGKRLAILVEPRICAPAWKSLQDVGGNGPVMVRIRSGASVKGRIGCGDEAAGTPQVEATLQSENGLDLSVKRDVRVEKDGSFVVSGLSAGLLWVTFSAAGHRQERIRVEVPFEEEDRDIGTLCPGKPVKVRGIVRLTSSERVEGALVSYGTARTKSNGKGEFELVTSGPPEERLRVEKERFLPWEKWIRIGENAPGFGVTLKKGARIIGTALDFETRRPISQLNLMFYFTDRPSEGRPAVLSPNRPGRFESPLLEPASYYMVLTAPGFQGNKVTVEGVAEGEMRDLGAVTLRRGIQVSGRVLAPDGTLVGQGEATLRLSSLAGYFRGASGVDRFSSTIDDEGRFRISGLKPEQYKLRVTARGFADLLEELGFSEDTDLGDLYLPHGCSLKGVVRNTSAEPVPSLTVEVRSGDSINLVGQRFTSTGEDGSFVLENLTPGPVALVIRSGRRKIKESTISLEGEPCQGEAEIQVGGTTLEGLAVRRGAPLANRSMILRPVRAAAEKSTESAVYLRSVAPNGDQIVEEVLGMGAESRFFGTDARGFYSVSNLEPGEWEVVLQDGAQVLPRQILVPDISLFHLDIDFTGRSVEGAVVRAESREPIGDAQVYLLPVQGNNPVNVVSTDSGGRFAFSDIVSSAVRVSATKPGFQTEIIRVNLEASSPGFAQIELRPIRQRASGIVRGPDGTRVAGAQVLWILEGPGVSRGGTERTDSDGGFVIADLEPGLLNAICVFGSYGAQPRYAWLQASEEEAMLEFQLSAASSIRVLLPAGQLGGTLKLFAGPADLTLLLWRAGLSPTLQPGGVWLWSGLGAGSYRLAMGNVIQTLDVGSGEQPEIDLRSR